MKTLRLASVGLFLTGTLMAATPFSTSSTGYDWLGASKDYKMEYCTLMATANQKIAPGITKELIFGSLEEFYRTSDASLLNQKIVQMVALTVTVYVHSR